MLKEHSAERPYPGLRPFEPWEGDIFFGREAHTDRLLEILHDRHFLTVIGPSGSGKSSLVRAGLLPVLPLGAIGTGSDWRIAILRPGNHPIRSLAEALLDDEVLGSELEGLTPALLEAELRGETHSLAHLLAQVRMNNPEADFNLFVLVDQFEEIFTYAQAGSRQSDESEIFINILLAASAVIDQRIFVTLTMRTDFLGLCVRFLELPEAINRSQYLTPRMTRDQLREAIRGPARLFGGDVDLLLIEELINSVDNTPDLLPVLQHALARMWREACKRNPAQPFISRDDHDMIGGVSKALDQHADLVFDRLDNPSKEAAEQLFRAVTSARDTRASEPLIIRNPCTLRQISLWSGLAQESFRPVIEAFSDQDVCFLVANGPLDGAETVIDISHEALIRQWGKLKAWTENEAKRAKKFQQLQERANDYANGNGELLSGIDLGRAKEWRDGGYSADAKWRPMPGWSERYTDPKAGLPDLVSSLSFLDNSIRTANEEKENKKKEVQRERDAVALRRKILRLLVFLFVFVSFLITVTFYVLFLRGQARDSAKEATIRRLVAEGQAVTTGVQSGGSMIGMLQMLAAHRLASKYFPQVSPGALGALQSECFRSARLVRLVENDEAIRTLALSADGLRIVTGSRNGTVRLWDGATGNPLGEPLTGHADYVNSVAFSQDGKYVVSASRDHTLRLWNASTGDPVGQPIKNDSAVSSVAFSPDGKRIVSGGLDGNLRLWDTASGNPIDEPLKGHTDAVYSVAFSPDGRRIVSGSSDKTLRLWDGASGNLIGEPLAGHTDVVYSVAFSPDGRRIVSGSYDKTLRLWDAASGNPVGEPMIHRKAVLSAAFSPDGRSIVSGGEDNFVRLWDAETGKRKDERFRGHTDDVTGVAFSPDGERIVSGSYDKTLRLWDATDNSLGKPLKGHRGAVFSVAFSPDGKHIVSGSEDTSLRLWEAASGSAIGKPFAGHSETVYSVAFSGDGKRLVSGSEDKTLRLWDVASGNPLGQPLAGHAGTVYSVAFSPDGKRIVSGSEDSSLRLWDAASGSLVGKPLAGHSGIVYSVAFSRPDGERLVSGSEDNSLRLWDAASGNPIGEPLTGHTKSVNSVAFSPDGQRIVSASDDRTLRLWHAATGALVGKPLTGHSHYVNSAAFSPDGRYIVSGSKDGTLRLWDTRIGAPVGVPLEGHTESIYSVAFSTDGKSVVSGSEDKTLRRWPVLESWADALCAKLSRNMTRAEWQQLVSPDIAYIKQCPNQPDPPD
jgi:WD40 repeat protein